MGKIKVGDICLTDGLTCKGRKTRDRVTVVAIKDGRPVIASKGIRIIANWDDLTPQVIPHDGELTS